MESMIDISEIVRPIEVSFKTTEEPILMTMDCFD